jgi:hypothetical protein
MCWPSTDTRPRRVVALDASTYRRHAIHVGNRMWAETNCYTDVAIELLHGLGHEPLAVLPFTLAIDFEGDQWTFFKPPHADVLELYGLDIQELAIWRPLVEHVVEQIALGRPVLVELDSYYLPDTAGTTYRAVHQKTTIGVNEIDVELRHLGYFHNQGYFTLGGTDFTEIFQIDGAAHERILPSYVEFAKMQAGFTRLRDNRLVGASLELLRKHLARVPAANPFARFRERLDADLEWLLKADIARFHQYSFATLRQCGACFELAETYLHWLGAHGIEAMGVSAAALRELSQAAKAFQFQLARSIARGKALDLAPLDAMGAQWESALAPLQSRFG